MPKGASSGGGQPSGSKQTFITHTAYLPSVPQRENPIIKISKCRYFSSFDNSAVLIR